MENFENLPICFDIAYGPNHEVLFLDNRDTFEDDEALLEFVEDIGKVNSTFIQPKIWLTFQADYVMKNYFLYISDYIMTIFSLGRIYYLIIISRYLRNDKIYVV